VQLSDQLPESVIKAISPISPKDLQLNSAGNDSLSKELDSSYAQTPKNIVKHTGQNND